MKLKFIPIAATLLVLSVVTACTPAAATPAADASKPTVRQLNVSGHGQVFLTPDVAYIYIGVETKADNVAQALSQNTDSAQGIASALKNLGVDAKDIQTSAFNVSPQQEFDPQGQIKGTVYVVNNTVYVTVRDLTKLGQILDTVVKSGANSINGIQFDVLDKSKALSQARQMAIDDASKQAAEIAKAVGVQLGPVDSVNVYTSGSPVPMFEGKGGTLSAAPAQVPVSAGQMILAVDANLVYEIK